MFDNINRKTHNQFYLNIEFVGGQILLRCFCQVSSVSNLYLNKIEVHLDFYTFTFFLFGFFLIIERRCPGVRNHTDVSSAIYNARDFVGIAGRCTFQFQLKIVWIDKSCLNHIRLTPNVRPKPSVWQKPNVWV